MSTCTNREWNLGRNRSWLAVQWLIPDSVGSHHRGVAVIGQLVGNATA